MNDSLPIPTHLISKVTRTGAQLREKSRYLRAISVDATAPQIARIRKLREVIEVTPVGVLTTLDAVSARPPVRASARRGVSARPPVRPSARPQFGPSASLAVPDSAYGPNLSAYKELGIPTAHTLGFTGRGVRIAILDTGFRTTHESLVNANIVARRDFVQGDAVVSDQPGDAPGQDLHGTQVLSLLAANRANKLIGTAFEASFILAKVDREPRDTGADEDRWVAALEWADSLGARIISSSVGYRYEFTDKAAYPFEAMNGRTTPTSRAAAVAARRGILVVNAIGNYGPATGTLVAPADADSIIAVGATDTLGQPAVFNPPTSATSRGPSADQRIKPDLSARGVNITVAAPVDQFEYVRNQGTSMSTPLVAGAAALVLQAWPGFAPMAVRQALIFSASRANTPNNSVGYGVPDVASAILFPAGFFTGDVSTSSGGRLTTLTPTFRWVAPAVHPSISPVKYRLAIATDSAFANVVYRDSVNDAFTLTVRRALQPGPQYYWRVTAEAAAGIRRRTNTDGPFTVPKFVTLITFSGTSPEFVNTLRPTLAWDPLPAPPPVGPLVFDVQVLNAQTLSPVQTIRNVTTSSVTLTEPLTPNVPYVYRVIARTPGGVADTVRSVAPFVATTSTAPPSTTLYQNFPNPFPRGSRTATEIWFDLHERTDVELSVFDIRGRLVRRLIPGSGCTNVTLDAGLYGRGGAGPTSNIQCGTTVWDGTDDSGSRVEGGVYVIRLRTQSAEQTRRVLYTP